MRCKPNFGRHGAIKEFSNKHPECHGNIFPSWLVPVDAPVEEVSFSIMSDKIRESHITIAFFGILKNFYVDVHSENQENLTELTDLLSDVNKMLKKLKDDSSDGNYPMPNIRDWDRVSWHYHSEDDEY